MSGGPEEQHAGMVEMLFLDLVVSACHQSIDLSVPRPAVEGIEKMPITAEEKGGGGAQRGAWWSQSYYAISPALSGINLINFSA
jgi:pyruvate/2-oxoglutarate/acetoin dehydrogenase E1 component